MAKSAKHKKLRKKEKAKTQLKGVTKLGKAQNVVEPTLKTKKIVVREQLTQKVASGDVVYTKHNQSIQDVLTSLNHHNANVKKEGFKGLEELISSQSNLLEVHLDRILEKTAALTYDEESSIRKENLKLAEIIFARVNENQVKPFWNTILMHIKCTLTSLNSVIRYSSLSFLQLLVSYFPNLVCSSLHTILPNLLGLISSSPGTGKGSSQNHKTARLKIEISEKHSDIKERLRVLTLIAICLDLRQNSLKDSSQSKSKNVNKKNKHLGQVDEEKHRNRQMIILPNYLSLYYPSGYQTLSTDSDTSLYGLIATNPAHNCRNLSTQNESIFLSSFSGNTELPLDQIWIQFIHSCMAIICETWVEVGPSNDTKTPGLKGNKRNKTDRDVYMNTDTNKNSRAEANLNTTAIDVLSCIMNVMKHLIGGWVSSSDENVDLKHQNSGEELWKILRKRYGGNIAKHFLQWLPFSAIQDSQYNTIAGLNLQLFNVAAQLHLFDSNMMNRLDSYLSWLTKKSSLDTEKTTLVLNIFSCLHLTNVGDLMTKFICHSLVSGHGPIIHNFLNSIFSGNDTVEKTGLLKSLQWNDICIQIIESAEELSPETLNLLTLVSIRKLTDVKTIVDINLSLFLNYCQNQNTVKTWEDTIRVFYYCNSLETLMAAIDAEDIPQEVQGTLKTLQS